MALTTYEEVRPWARAIKQKTAARDMPPWFIEKDIGIQAFKDDPSLSEEDIALIGRWVDGGAPRGNAGDMPPPRTFGDRNAWSIGEPDLVVSSPVYTVKAEGSDWFGYGGNTPTGLTEDRWIAALEFKEFRPDETTRASGREGGGNNYFAIHHAVVGTRPQYAAPLAAGTDDEREARRPAGVFSYTYEVGQNAQMYPADLGIKLPARSTVYFNNNHLHSIGKEVKVQLKVGFKLHPKEYQPKYPQGLSGLSEMAGMRGMGADLDIPAGYANVRFDRYAVLARPARMVTFEPHLHASGKRMCVEAIYPSGDRETLNCAGYNHAWVKSYVYAEDAAPLLPAGTIVHAIAWYDNTTRNPRVVDPRNWKGLGHRSIDDMFLVFNKLLYLSEDEFKAEVAARDAKRRQHPAATPAHHQ
jgi:hypothetical protein